MRRLIEKHPGGYEDWVRQTEAPAASTAQHGSEAKSKVSAASKLDQSLQPGASKAAVVDASASVVNGPVAGFEAPEILQNGLFAEDTLSAARVKDTAEPVIKEQAPVAQAPRVVVIPAGETAPAPEVGKRILKGSAAGAESSTADEITPLERLPTAPIPLPFASTTTSPLATSTPNMADATTADPPNLARPSALPTLPATTFSPAAAPTLSVTPPTPMTPRGPRARVESPLLDSSGTQLKNPDPVAELTVSEGEAAEKKSSETGPVIATSTTKAP